MLDPCSTSSYISENAAEELELQGQELNLTIAGTGGTEVSMQLRRVELTVTNLGRFPFVRTGWSEWSNHKWNCLWSRTAQFSQSGTQHRFITDLW